MKTYTWTFNIIESRFYNNIVVVAPDEESAIEAAFEELNHEIYDDADTDIELVDKELGYHE